MSDSVITWTTAYQASLSFTISWSLLKFMSIGSVMLSNHLFLCHPLLLLPSLFSSIKLFSNKSALHIGWASLVAQTVKRLPTMRETWVRSLGWEDPFWRRKWQDPFWRRKWQPTPVLLPGKSHELRSLVG